MANKQELLNAMNVIKEHCGKTDCCECCIDDECTENFRNRADKRPSEWVAEEVTQ